MNFLTFLKYKKSYVAGSSFALILIGFVLFASSINKFFAILTFLVLVMLLLVPIVKDYTCSRTFMLSLNDYANSIDADVDFTSIVDDPKDELQELLYEFGKSADRKCKSAFQQAKTEKEDYCNYIESWVHEIKTPLSASVLIANRSNEPEKSELMSQFELINQELDEVLWYARANSVGKDYRIKAVNLLDLLTSICKKNARYLIEKGTVPNFDIDEKLNIYCDEKWCGFIISQAVINSAKYHAKTITFSAETKGTESYENCISLYIHDDGDGIPASDLPYIFEPAFVGKRGREGSASTGMGLYLSAKMCKKLGIGIEVFSDEEKGTTVRLDFPFDDTILQFCNKSVS